MNFVINVALKYSTDILFEKIELYFGDKVPLALLLLVAGDLQRRKWMQKHNTEMLLRLGLASCSAPQMPVAFE